MSPPLTLCTWLGSTSVHVHNYSAWAGRRDTGQGKVLSACLNLFFFFCIWDRAHWSALTVKTSCLLWQVFHCLFMQKSPILLRFRHYPEIKCFVSSGRPQKSGSADSLTWISWSERADGSADSLLHIQLADLMWPALTYQLSLLPLQVVLQPSPAPPSYVVSDFINVIFVVNDPCSVLYPWGNIRCFTPCFGLSTRHLEGWRQPSFFNCDAPNQNQLCLFPCMSLYTSSPRY